MSDLAPVAPVGSAGLPATLVPADDVPWGMTKVHGDLITALALAQSILVSPTRNKHVTVERPNGERYDFRYASLDVINDMIRGPLADNGLVLTHLTRPTKAGLFLLTRLHLKGTEQSMQNVTPIYLEHKSPHAFASAVTYAKRYAICTMLNIAAEEDDDGNAAMGNRVIDHDFGTDPEAVQAVLRSRFKDLIASANEAGSPADVVALLRRWQRDTEDFGAWANMPERAGEWELLLRLVPAAIARVHGPEMADAWAGAVKARDPEDLATLRERWGREWTPAANKMRRASPAGFALLMDRMRAQTTRVERLADAMRAQKPPEETPRADPQNTAEPPKEEPLQAPGCEAAPEPEPEGHALRDEEGDLVSEPIAVPAVFAEGYVEQDAYADDREKLRTANAEGLAWCAADPGGAAVLEENLGAWVLARSAGHPGEAAKSPSDLHEAAGRGATTLPTGQHSPTPEPPPPVPPEAKRELLWPPVPLARTGRGTPDLGRYLVAVKRSLTQAETREHLDGWEEANAPTYGTLPQSFRLQVLAAFASREQVLGLSRGAYS